MENPFAQIGKVETSKREIRASVEVAVRRAMDGTALTPERLATRLISFAYYINMGWSSAGKITLEKLADGRITTDEELLRLTANRHLSAGSRAPAKDP